MPAKFQNGGRLLLIGRVKYVAKMAAEATSREEGAIRPRLLARISLSLRGWQTAASVPEGTRLRDSHAELDLRAPLQAPLRARTTPLPCGWGFDGDLLGTR